MLKEFSQMGKIMGQWHRGLEPIALEDLIPDEDAAKRTFVFSADMIVDFCVPDCKEPTERPLASNRVGAISLRVADILTKVHNAGGGCVLVQEWHNPNAKEFGAFPPHGIAGTVGADTISWIRLLPFADKFSIFLKNALTPAWAYREKRHEPPEKTHPIYPQGHSPVFRESFARYLETHDIRTAIVVGNCTDLCVRELAMHLRMWANEHQKDMRIVIPENCVQTFDLPFDVAEQLGVMPHPGDVYHIWALYEMARNKIEVVKEVV
jgi:nicotinamidase-related amidase